MSGVDAREARLLDAAGYEPPPDYAWTEASVEASFSSADVAALTATVIRRLEDQEILLPERERLVRRCVVGLLSGHVVLQGPPGTGKTTLARVLAEAFKARLVVTTATADWSTYDVVGGLRPASGAALVPRLGAVPSAALACAEAVRDETDAQAVWLLLDELNRADIDKAIGPLYTVLSSVTSEHLKRTPLELWFSEGAGSRLWIPSRFRIIGTMNDVDTSFVNALSQGLTRRFQFLYVGVPERSQTQEEVWRALSQAREWVSDRYALSQLGSLEALSETTADTQARLVSVLQSLRFPAQEVAGWPVGTAQVVDVWRSYLLQDPDGRSPNAHELLDEVLADRIVPQMSTLDRDQLEHFRTVFGGTNPAMPSAVEAITHLVNPHAPL